MLKELLTLGEELECTMQDDSIRSELGLPGDLKDKSMAVRT